MSKANMKDVFTENFCNKDKINNIVLNNERKEKFMKKYTPYVMGVIIVCIIAGTFIFINNKDTKKMSIDYKGYLSENKLLAQEKNDLKTAKSDLDKKFKTDQILDTDYEKEKENINNQILKLSAKQDELKKKYNIKDDMDLSNYIFDSDPKLDKEYKDLYNREKELDALEDALDLEEEELDNQYRSGKIDKKTYISKKVELELKEDEIDAKEEEYDKLEDKLDEIEDKLEEEKDRLEDEEDKRKEQEEKEEEKRKEEEEKLKEQQKEQEEKRKEEEEKLKEQQEETDDEN